MVYSTGLLMLLYAKWGKFRHRDMMLNMLRWRGDERVLDVGTGRGLLLIGAARRLTTGRGTGIDVWSTKDLSGNSLSRTQANIDVEGVQDKVNIKSDDARKLSFPDASFDVVLSNLCIHNIPASDGRAQACREIARVLKPGGTALISDLGEHRLLPENICCLRAQGKPHKNFNPPYISLVESREG